MNIVYSIGGSAITNRVNFLKEGGSFVTAAFKCEYASGGIRIEDPSGNLNIAGWDTFWVDDMDATPTRVWQGYIFDKTLSRGDLPPTGVNRVHDCDIIDLNAALQFQVLHSNDAKRPAETDVARVNWLMTSEAITGYGSNLLADLGLISAVGPVDFLDKDCRGSFANGVLRTLCEIAQKNAFAYFDGATGNAGLFYDKDASAVYDSTIRISNVIADADGVTTFYPDSEARLHQRADERYGGVLFEWQGDPIYAQSPATVAAMGFSRDAVISDDKQIGDAATAEAEAVSYLNTHATEDNAITVTILMPSESVNLLYAGMRMQVKFTHLEGYESFTWARTRTRGVRTIGVDVDGTWTVLWQVDLELWVPPVPIDDAEPTDCVEGSPTIVQQVNNGPYSGSGATTLTLPGAVTAGNILIVASTRRGGAMRVDRIQRDNVSGPDRDFTTFGSPVQFGAPTDASFLAYRVATGDEQVLWFEDAGHITLWEVTGSDATAVAAATVLRQDQQSAAMSYPIGTLGLDGGLAFAVWLYGLDFNDTDFWTIGAGWTADYQDSTDGGSPWTEMGHAALTGPILATETSSVSIAWGGMAVAFGGCEDPETPLPFLGDPVGPETPAGTVDNANTDFTTAGPFLAGTLRVLHDGTDQTAHVTTSDPTAGTFTLDYAPSTGSALRTIYASA